VPGDVPDEWVAASPLAARGRAGSASDAGGRPYVSVADGRVDLAAADRDRVVDAVTAADRGLLVAGPADAPTPAGDALVDLARATGFPILADPLSGLRFGDHVDDESVRLLAGYDGWVGALSDAGGFDPDVVVRFGASPTSKPLRKALAAVEGARQFVVDPAGGWREAEFAATDLLVAEPTRFATAVVDRVDRAPAPAWHDRLARAEAAHRAAVADAGAFWEGAVLADVVARAPDPATLFVSNSMPVRDLDRFGRARAADLTVLGNRGASGIDGITSTALGAGSATDDPLVCVTGDLAYYHDMNGLLAVARAGVDATFVLVNNDGGGIFHQLPIEAFDPPFERLFRTPHGLDFEPSAALYDLSFERVTDRSGFGDAFAAAVGREGTDVLEVRLSAADSHATRDRIEDRVATEIERSLAGE
jgi:2-succinyl-5-enolpyruvyl-6-hydroxy-3-cyclohexene-1-carboxylate synthase